VHLVPVTGLLNGIQFVTEQCLNEPVDDDGPAIDSDQRETAQLPDGPGQQDGVGDQFADLGASQLRSGPEQITRDGFWAEERAAAQQLQRLRYLPLQRGH